MTPEGILEQVIVAHVPLDANKGVIEHPTVDGLLIVHMPTWVHLEDMGLQAVVGVVDDHLDSFG